MTVGLSGCSDNPASEDAVLQDVVMIEAMTSSSTTFAVALPGNPNVAYLTTEKVLKSDEVKPGDCCLIRYITPAKPYESANINLLGCYGMPNIEAEFATVEEMEAYTDTPVYLISAWSFCNRIIMKMELPFPANNRKLMLLYDPTSADGTPVLHLIQDTPESTAGSYMKSYVVAFSLDKINEKKEWKDVKIILNNSNLKENELNLKLKN